MHSEALFSRMHTHVYSKLDKTTTHLYRTWTASDCTPTCEFFGASAGQTGEQRLGYFRCSAADMLSLKSAMQQVHYKYAHTPSLTHIHTFTHTHTPTHTFTHTHTRHSGTRKQATTHTCARPHAQVHMRTHTFPLFQAHIHLDGYSRCERRGGLSGNVRQKKYTAHRCAQPGRNACAHTKNHTHARTCVLCRSLCLSQCCSFCLSLCCPLCHSLSHSLGLGISVNLSVPLFPPCPRTRVLFYFLCIFFSCFRFLFSNVFL